VVGESVTEQSTLARNTFVGRERELAELVSACESGAVDGTHLFLISGEPGIGKTRLADELSWRARTRGMQVLWGRCWEGDGAPAYWPWIQVIRAYLGALDPERRNLALESETAADIIQQVAQIVPELRHAQATRRTAPSDNLDPIEARFRLFDAVTNFLKIGAHSNPMLIVLDDLHDADEASLAMLRFLARELKGTPVIIIATHREAEVACSPSLSAIIGELARDARVIPLRGLSEAEVKQFVAVTSGFTPTEPLVTRLHDSTNGNPLFLDGLVRILIADNQIDSAASADNRLKIPVGVKEAINLRLATLSAEAMSILRVAAAIGKEFSFELCRSVADVGADDARRALDEASRAGIVTEVDGGQYRFAHALIRDEVYGTFDSTGRIGIHDRIAWRLEQIYREKIDAHAAELAYHFRLAGIASKAIDYSIRAGTAADCALAFREAIDLWDLALNLLEKHGGDPRRRAGLLYGLGITAFNIDHARSIKYAEASLALYDAIGDVEKTAEIHCFLGEAFQIWGTPQENIHRAREHLRKAESVLASGAVPITGFLARAYMRLAAVDVSSLDLAAALATGKRAMELASQLGSDLVWTEAASRYATVLFMTGRLREAFSLWDRAYANGDRMNDPVGAFTVSVNAGGFSLILLDPLLSRTWLERELSKPRQAQASWRRQFLSGTIGVALANEGNLAEARRLIGGGVPPEQLKFHEEGVTDELVNYLELAVSDAIRRGNYFLQITFQHTLARAYVSRDEYSLAETVLLDTLQPREGGPLVACEMLNRPLLATVYVEKNQLEASRSQIVRCQEIVAMGEDWRGLVGQVECAEAVNLAAAGRFADAEAHFEKAVAISSRCPVAYLQADARCHWGRALNAAGKYSEANEKFDAAIDIYRRHGFGQRWIDRVEAARPSLATGGKARKSKPASPVAEIFRREVEFWTITYAGATFRLKDAKGLHYVAYLLACPGERFHVVDLIAAVDGTATNGNVTTHAESEGLSIVRDVGGAGSSLDARARSEYRTRLHDLHGELDEAERMNDLGRSERTRIEIEQVSDELIRSSGVGGRARTASDSAERARGLVGKNIRSILEKIRHEHPALGRHFAAAVSTGYFCAYQPDPDHLVFWQF
jgi:tetratricopeptide (TPR) repeat protein